MTEKQKNEKLVDAEKFIKASATLDDIDQLEKLIEARRKFLVDIICLTDDAPTK
ncbi:hypothetical protein [Companilactobacillus versmoldensis]|uniref:Uncharacterized protein n=1 Tax=Companilactobacillus versmoldensis DSM 14857 = KCTC 3814 TaxID=1423815 RepID=A0A0R1SJH7_9LACO|nr:hypothetical protein [Companilactobacillus versmoldensis]KRL66642.1 hypothetical protein FC27_GL000517 [Companilactobacillus versmoldensis DSM 14857 = KCTC 3814]